MQTPVQITFRDMTPSPAVTDHVEKRASKLDVLFDGIIDCHVVVEEPHRRSRNGPKFHVRIQMHVPSRELVVTRTPEDTRVDLYATIDDAFNEAERVLEDHVRLVQPDARAHARVHSRPLHGTVARVFQERGYGFLAAEDGHEVYFHRNSVIDGSFDKIVPGTKVRFAEEDGDKGPQASTVHVVGNDHGG
jgi:ribosomal subunit interface protein